MNLVALFLALLLPSGLGSLGVAGTPTPEAVVHDFHISYGRVAVEKNVVVYRVRFFKDDLEEALRAYHKDADFALEVNPQMDAKFAAYFNDKLNLIVGGQRLTGKLIGSGEEMEGKEPMWWYALQYEAPATIQQLTIKNKLLLELFEDQKNIVKVQHFPDNKQQSYYFDDDTVEHTASF